jgi:RNA polymerase sigma factor (sigma-70 family)
MHDIERSAPSELELEDAIARLPRLQREAFLMAARDGLSYPAIAKRLKVSHRRIARLVAKALVRLDRALHRSQI